MPWLRNFCTALFIAVLATVGRAQPTNAAGAAQAGGALVEVFRLAEAGRWPEALAAAERAQGATPDDPRIGLVRIQALVELGREAEAEQILDEELWYLLGQERWRSVLQAYPSEVLASWSRRVALRRFARGAPAPDTSDAVRAALAGGGQGMALEHQLALALVAVRTGPRTGDVELAGAGHALFAARCPPTWAAGALLLPWALVLLLVPWGSRGRGLATALGAGLLVAELQVLGAGLAGAWTAGVWTLLLEPPLRAEVLHAAALGAALGAAALALVLVVAGLLRGRPSWYREWASLPTGEDLREGLRWGAGVVAWLGLLVVAQAAWRAARGDVGLVEAVGALLSGRDPWLAAGGGWLAAGVMLRVLVAPWLEEALFRGAVFERLLAAFDWRGAAVLSACAFAFAHGRDPMALIGVGILLAAARHRTQRLWPCVIAHAVWNLVGLGLALGLS